MNAHLPKSVGKDLIQDVDTMSNDYMIYLRLLIPAAKFQTIFWNELRDQFDRI